MVVAARREGLLLVFLVLAFVAAASTFKSGGSSRSSDDNAGASSLLRATRRGKYLCWPSLELLYITPSSTTSSLSPPFSPPRTHTRTRPPACRQRRRGSQAFLADGPTGRHHNCAGDAWTDCGRGGRDWRGRNLGTSLRKEGLGCGERGKRERVALEDSCLSTLTWLFPDTGTIVHPCAGVFASESHPLEQCHDLGKEKWKEERERWSIPSFPSSSDIYCFFHVQNAHTYPRTHHETQGGSIANVISGCLNRHPYADRPLLDFNLILMMEPTTIVGTCPPSLPSLASLPSAVEPRRHPRASDNAFSLLSTHPPRPSQARWSVHLPTRCCRSC